MIKIFESIVYLKKRFEGTERVKQKRTIKQFKVCKQLSVYGSERIVSDQRMRLKKKKT